MKVVWEDQREQVKRAKAAEKEAKKARYRELKDWQTDTMVEGSPEQIRSVKRLQKNVWNTKVNFATYAEDMSKYTSKDKATEEMNKLNTRYMRTMANYCLSPLTDGVSSTTVLDCVGMYVGMCLVSPSFRHQVNKDVSAALLPLVELSAKRNCTIKNAMSELRAKVTGSDVIKTYEVDDDRRVRKLRERYAKADNEGRTPFSPESAALTQLKFITSAYQAMRMPGADTDEIMQQFQEASSALKTLADKDGISEEQLNQNVRTIAGQFIDAYPEYRRVFMETAYDDVEKASGEVQTAPNGVKTEVWRGQFRNKDGTPYTGPFTPRPPMSEDDYRSYIGTYMQETFDGCADINEVQKVGADPKVQRTMSEFVDMLEDDLPAYCENYDEAEALIRSGRPSQVVNETHRAYGEYFARSHPPTQSDYDAWRRSQHRDVSDIPDFDDPNGFGGGYSL